MKAKLKWLAVIAAVLGLLVPFNIHAEEAENPAEKQKVVTPLDGSGTVLSALPMDDYIACGPVPDPERYTEEGYTDPSIEVRVWREWVDDACVNAAIVKIADPSQLRTALAKDSITKNHYVWVTAEVKNAVVACGGEFLAHKSNQKTYTVRMSQVLRKKGMTSRDALITDQNGDFHILRPYSKNAREALEGEGIRIINCFNFGPALVIDGETVYQAGAKLKYPVGYTNANQPRTAIGQIGPLEYLIAVVNGRGKLSPAAEGETKRSAGLDVIRMGEFMQRYGCRQAYCLDGGGSAAMYFQGIYNVPAEKRGVTDIVYFATLLDSGIQKKE